MIRPIVLLGDPILRQKAEPIEKIDDEIKTLINDMFQTMRDARGMGLAANQVGVAKRVFVAETGRFWTAFVNPRIVEASKTEEVETEGCLSIPDKTVKVRRPSTVIIEAENEMGVHFRLACADWDARVVQHEMDHLDGILIIDKALES